MAVLGSDNITHSTDFKFNINSTERMRINNVGKILAAAGTHWTGTVSQNGTSSIIEQGSNANGEFVKYADGTMICWQRDTNATYDFDDDRGNGWVVATLGNKTFPANFVSSDVGVWAARDRGVVRIIGFTSAPLSSTWRSVNIAQVGDLRIVTGQRHTLFAIGRWY